MQYTESRFISYCTTRIPLQSASYATAILSVHLSVCHIWLWVETAKISRHFFHHFVISHHSSSHTKYRSKILTRSSSPSVKYRFSIRNKMLSATLHTLLVDRYWLRRSLYRLPVKELQQLKGRQVTLYRRPASGLHPVSLSVYLLVCSLSSNNLRTKKLQNQQVVQLLLSQLALLTCYRQVLCIGTLRRKNSTACPHA